MTTPHTRNLARALDFIEQTGRRGGYDAIASFLGEKGWTGEPLLQGRDPLSRFLSSHLQTTLGAVLHEDDLQVVVLPSETPLRAYSLDAYPLVRGFLYCLLDFRFLELSPPTRPESDDDH